MPVLDVLGDRVPVRIIGHDDGGRVRVVLTRVGAEMVVPSHLIHAADDEPALDRPRTRPGRLTELQLRVLESLDRAGPMGMTDDEHEAANGLRSDSAGKRRIEMCRLGYVVDTGDHRDTRRGGHAKVWQITTSGHTELARHRNEGAA